MTYRPLLSAGSKAASRIGRPQEFAATNVVHADVDRIASGDIRSRGNHLRTIAQADQTLQCVDLIEFTESAAQRSAHCRGGHSSRVCWLAIGAALSRIRSCRWRTARLPAYRVWTVYPR